MSTHPDNEAESFAVENSEDSWSESELHALNQNCNTVEPNGTEQPVSTTAPTSESLDRASAREENIRVLMRDPERNESLVRILKHQYRCRRASINRSTTKKEREACFRDASTQTEELFAPLFDERAMTSAVQKDAEEKAKKDMKDETNRSFDQIHALKTHIAWQESRVSAIRKRNDYQRLRISKLEDDKRSEDVKIKNMKEKNFEKIKERAIEASKAIQQRATMDM